MKINLINKNSDSALKVVFDYFLEVEKLCQKMTHSDEPLGDFADSWIINDKSASFEDNLFMFSDPFIKHSMEREVFVFQVGNDNYNYYLWFGSESIVAEKISNSACCALAEAFSEVANGSLAGPRSEKEK